MGGDHKCPVCQATFTRPQHVARHMRSHTGDRPYKCQYCGDQFARSDLLSRHVNKCHSNERPLPGLSARRKGAAAASRATTSKQACDQCVQASLPCDGANPCSKCAARKYRCTYVKFHRQTAPAGPGHETRLPSANPSVPSTIGPDDPLLSQTLFRDDPFLLAPPPGNAPSSGSGAGNGVPQTMAETLFHSHSFAFPTLYPQSTSPSIGLGPGGAGGSFPGGGLGTRTGFTPLFEQRGGAGGWLGGWTDGDILPPLHPQQQPGVGPGLSVSSQSMHTGSAPMPPQTQQLQQQDAPSVAISMPYPGYLLPPMPAPSTLAATLAQAQSGSGDSTLGQTQLDQQQQQLNQQRLDHHHHMEHQERMLRHEQQQQQRGRVYAQQQAGTGSISQQHSTHGSSQSMQGSHHNSHPHSHSTSRPGTSSSAGGASVHTGTRRSSTSTGPPLSQDGGGQYGSYSASGPYRPHSSNGAAQDYHAGGAREYYKNRDFRDGHPYGEDDDERFAFVDEDDRGQWSVTDNFSLVPERAGSASTSSSSSHRHPSTGYDDGLSDHGFSHTTEDRQGGEVHDAFGLMSLDDPAVLAGIAADGQPFFSDPNATHNQDMDTPMPTKRPGAPGGMQLLLPPTPAREQDTRELRDFWKQYMRTPLSGPAPDPTTASGSGHPLGGAGPRKRVASLPSVKTPIVEKDHLYANANQGAAAGQAGGAGGMSSMRTTLHRPEEDLRSYEAAVLARKAPTQLKLQARRKTHQQGGTGNSYVPSQQQQQQHQQQRPTSASDTDAKMPHTSSLAHAFGVGSSAAPGGSASNAGGASGRSATRVAFAVDEADSPAAQSSRASSVSADGHGTGSDGDSSRPSFKRLPSQTLGPSAAKRAFLGFGDNDERVAGWGPGVGAGTAAISEAANKTANAVEIKQEGNVNLNGTGAAGSGMGTGVPSSNLSHPDRVVASLAERRRRRMSAPSGSLVLPDLHSLQPGTSQG